MIPKPIDAITEDVLKALVSEKVLERKTLEYKAVLVCSSDADKKEFLADVSSFANASGGDIVYGIAEDPQGLPMPATGMPLDNPDKEVLRLNQIVMTGIQPRIPNVAIRPLLLSNGNCVIIVRVPRSWLSPHRVTFGKHNEFYCRTSNGKYPLDVTELRSAFLQSETASERIRSFREQRIASIVAGETPVPLLNNPKLILHLIPASAFSDGPACDLGRVERDPVHGVRMYDELGMSHRYNADGMLVYSVPSEDKLHGSYAQFFRNGVVEWVKAWSIKPRDGHLYLPTGYEKLVVKTAGTCARIFRTLEVAVPVIALLTITGAKGYIIFWDRLDFHNHTLDKDVLLVPDVMMEDLDVPPEEFMRPAFDIVWNGCGYARSMNYDENGDWNPQ